jgi:PII-like signaling protein
MADYLGGMMQAICLKLFVTENQKHGGQLLHEWLLEQAKRLGVPAGSVFRAIEGYGRHGSLHKETFFELAGDLPLEVEFVLSAEQAESLLMLLRRENLKLFYVKLPAEYGATG